MRGPFGEEEAAAPLTPAERADLIPTHVTLRDELNELELRNIADANGWAFRRKRNVLDEVFLRGLHRRMFNKVWRWAGEYRNTDRNLGVRPHLIQPDLLQAIDDARHWIELWTYQPDELSVRFHHRIVFVHPFPNGMDDGRAWWPICWLRPKAASVSAGVERTFNQPATLGPRISTRSTRPTTTTLLRSSHSRARSGDARQVRRPVCRKTC